MAAEHRYIVESTEPRKTTLPSYEGSTSEWPSSRTGEGSPVTLFRTYLDTITRGSETTQPASHDERDVA